MYSGDEKTVHDDCDESSDDDRDLSRVSSGTKKRNVTLTIPRPYWVGVL